MKTANTILFLLMLHFAFGQKGDFREMEIDDFQILSIEDFIDNGINSMSVYIYRVGANGKIGKDSLLIYRRQIDISENKLKILGIGNVFPYTERNGKYIEWHKFERYCNDNKPVIKKRRSPANIEELGIKHDKVRRIDAEYEYDTRNRIIKETTKKRNEVYYFSEETREIYGYAGYRIMISETDYQYDSLNNKIKETNTIIEENYTFSEQSKDTSLSSRVIFDTWTEEYVYNPNNQIIEQYEIVDSIRRLSAKWEYDSLSNSMEEITYGRSNDTFYRKENYFYDDQERLIKQTDSIRKIRKCCKDQNYRWYSTTTYEYTDTGKIVTETDGSTKTISYYNKEGKIVKICYVTNSGKVRIDYSYFYENNKLVKIVENRLSYFIDATTYSYNEKGLLKEELTTRNNKTLKLIRYYYE